MTFLLGLLIGMLLARNPKYAICGDCHTRVRINKPLIGDLHYCGDHSP